MGATMDPAAVYRGDGTVLTRQAMHQSMDWTIGQLAAHARSQGWHVGIVLDGERYAWVGRGPVQSRIGYVSRQWAEAAMDARAEGWRTEWREGWLDASRARTGGE